MIISLAILTTLKNYQIYCYHKVYITISSLWNTFPYKIFFRIMVVEKAFDVAMSTTKFSLCTAYNHLSVLFYV